MDLRTFIKTALVDIVSGVQDAQQATEEGTIVPATNVQTMNVVSSGYTPIQSVAFEVSVRAEESKGSEGRLGVVNSFIGAGVAGKSASQEGSASIIRFAIPIQLPTSGGIGKNGRKVQTA